jgi:hypothetical protein
MKLRIIKTENRKVVFLLGLIIPVTIDALFTYMPYRQGSLPEGRGFLAALLIGLLIITQYKGSTRNETALSVALFIFLLLFVLFFTSIYVSCLNGDCL